MGSRTELVSAGRTCTRKVDTVGLPDSQDTRRCLNKLWLLKVLREFNANRLGYILRCRLWRLLGRGNSFLDH